MNDILQNALVEHYVNAKGLITEQDIDVTVFQKWISLTNTLYNQALELNRRDWDNPTELKEYSLHDPIWDTIREIYDDVIGKVNGHILQRNTELVADNNILLYYVGTSRARLWLDIITTMDSEACTDVLQDVFEKKGHIRSPQKELAVAINAIPTR